MVRTDTMHVIHARAAGLDVHKMQITATVRVAHPGTEAEVLTRQFSALPSGLAALVDWLRAHAVSAAVMEGTGIYWEAPWQALEHAGIQALLVQALRAGSVTAFESSGYAAVLCGMAIASTKCAWKRGSTAVSIFSMRRTFRSISDRELRSSSATHAPVPAVLPAKVTRSRAQSGTSPSTIAYLTSMWLPNAPARWMRCFWYGGERRPQSQGTMNNILFGNDRHQCYETVSAASPAVTDATGWSGSTDRCTR